MSYNQLSAYAALCGTSAEQIKTTVEQMAIAFELDYEVVSGAMMDIIKYDQWEVKRRRDRIEHGTYEMKKGRKIL